MDLLLRNGAEVNIRGRSGWLAIHEASFDGLDTVVQFLIANGAWINVETYDGFAPLHLAAQNGNYNLNSKLKFSEEIQMVHNSILYHSYRT